MEPITLGLVTRLYRDYATELATVREEQRELLAARQPGMRAQLDDLEAEITYLLLRELRPDTVVEVGTFHGWSTTWILRALRDNGVGRLLSFDQVDHVLRTVPDELAGQRWTFSKGDVRTKAAEIPAETDYLFLDAAHSGSFARWYLTTVFPTLRAGTRVSVHDVFHGRRPLPFSEGAVLLGWLADRNIDYFTPSAKRAPEHNAALRGLKAELGLAEPVRTSRDNPMVFFDLA
ncbi:hypothetical protein GCM10010174_37700 [Kutzneria viridogrisea]|uniref:O-methyltransferase n=2 Tax=Kutzneria TaxID=43356 RepID=W5W1I7_9PSEU|nr:class I SAM-dependent methyltransferase [Kutzneria albida]AHH94677.1 hypothetical protein KALB_1304 [Kutzneria albida DSM 43870]MBA8930345.1 putative O-methyltransferase YrrM [Kutzneria viridogrisea]